MISILTNTHISRLFKRIGLIVLLKRSTCILIGKFNVLNFRKRENTMLACFAICFFVLRNVPVLEGNIPRYSDSTTICNSLNLK